MIKRATFSSSVKPSKLAEDMKALAEKTKPDPSALVEGVSPASRSKELKPVGKRYEGKKTMLIPLDPAMHRKLKMLAVGRDQTLEVIVQEAIAEFISKNNT